MAKNTKPDVLMFISESCPHCPAMMTNLINILKRGGLATLKIYNIDCHAQRAQQMNVRSLPWIKIGSFVIEGLCAASELEKWVRTESTLEGKRAYLVMLLESGKLHKAEEFLENEADGLPALLSLLADSETNISVRTGASALLEGLEGSKPLTNATKIITKMLYSDGANIRADACFFLGLTHNPGLIKSLAAMLKDSNEQVREIAEESIEKLSAYLD